MTGGYFHPVAGVDRREEVAANTRAFKGDGTPYLKVPGLLKVEGIRVNFAELPLVEKREYPVDHTHQRLMTDEFPTVALEQAQDGTPVLLRSITSNDGLWQDGEPIYVTGEWDDAVPAPEKIAPRKVRSTTLHEAVDQARRRLGIVHRDRERTAFAEIETQSAARAHHHGRGVRQERGLSVLRDRRRHH